jgi:hypothetical protein
MNTTHTPGPWAMQGQWSVDTPRGAMLAECIESPRGGIIGAWIGYGEDGRAENARLAAAAPEMLKALRDAEKAIRWAAQEATGRVKAEIVGGWLHHAEQVAAAIAKATGRD